MSETVVVTLMAKYMQRWAADMSDETFSLWSDVLGRFDHDLLERGFRRMAETYKYPSMPTPAEIVQHIEKDQSSRHLHRRAARERQLALSGSDVQQNDWAGLAEDQKTEINSTLEAYFEERDVKRPRGPVKPAYLNDRMGEDWVEERRQQAFTALRTGGPDA